MTCIYILRWHVKSMACAKCMDLWTIYSRKQDKKKSKACDCMVYAKKVNYILELNMTSLTPKHI